MNMDRLYSASQDLREVVEGVAREVASHLEEPLILVETITLPDVGQRVILRFELQDQHRLSSAAADALESRLRALVGRDYWANCTELLRQLDSGELARRFAAIDAALPASFLHFAPTRHSEAVGRDGDTVRRSLSLDRDYLVWEIEMPIAAPDAGPVIRILAKQEKGYGLCAHRPSGRQTVAGVPCDVVYLKHNPSFSGCVKAYVAAERRGIANSSFITQFEPPGGNLGKP